jgi:hypothetical protein
MNFLERAEKAGESKIVVGQAQRETPRFAQRLEVMHQETPPCILHACGTGQDAEWRERHQSSLTSACALPLAWGQLIEASYVRISMFAGAHLGIRSLACPDGIQLDDYPPRHGCWLK